jgi:hypothetical protein
VPIYTRVRRAPIELVDVLARAHTQLPLSTDQFLGAESFNVGLIDGGTAPNIVPDTAHVVVDHRTVGDGSALLPWWRDQPEVDRVFRSLVRKDHLKLRRSGVIQRREKNVTQRQGLLSAGVHSRPESVGLSDGRELLHLNLFGEVNQRVAGRSRSAMGLSIAESVIESQVPDAMLTREQRQLGYCRRQERFGVPEQLTTEPLSLKIGSNNQSD